MICFWGKKNILGKENSFGERKTQREFDEEIIYHEIFITMH
jgi:hypothetical protein